MDLISQILSRLPAKSILRFCCVSKLWNSIICSRYFNKLFHTVSSSNPRLFIGIESIGCSFFSSPQPQNNHGRSFIVVDADFHIKVPIKHLSSRRSYASGLILFSNGVMHAIYNPSTRQYAILPCDPRTSCLDSHSFLGFDPIDKQFKVLVYKERHNDEMIYFIMTLGNENERWREIKCPFTYGFPWNHININGVLFYLAIQQDDDNYNSDLIYFDIRFEKFKFLDSYVGDSFSKLINYKGKLGVVSNWNDEGFPLEIRMWVLKDIDKVEWIKYAYTLTPPKNIISDVHYTYSIIGATPSGDFVVGVTFSRDIDLGCGFAAYPFFVYYINAEKSIWRRVKIEGIIEGKEWMMDHLFFYFVDYVENLGFDFMKHLML